MPEDRALEMTTDSDADYRWLIELLNSKRIINFGKCILWIQSHYKV